MNETVPEVEGVIEFQDLAAPGSDKINVSSGTPALIILPFILLVAAEFWLFV